MGIYDYELLSWANLLNWQLMLVLVIGLVFMLAVALRPRLFWPLLIFSVIAGIVPRVMGYGLADEILMSAVFIGGVTALAVLKGRVKAKRTNNIGIRQVLFLFWMGYLIIQAFRGMVVTDDSRVVRWIFTYGFLAVGMLLVPNMASSAPTGRRLLRVTLVSTLVVFGVYIGQGVYAQNIADLGPFGSEFGRFLTQDRFVAGSATAVFPILAAIPSALIFMRDRSWRARLLAWATLFIIMSVAWYYDSRVTWLVMLAFLAVSLFRIGIARVAVISAVSLSMAFLFLPQPQKNLPGYLTTLYQATQQLWSPAQSDVGRNLDIRAGIMTSTEKWDTFLFGYGINSNKFVVVPNALYLRSRYLPPQTQYLPGTRDDTYATVIRPTGFTAYLLDTGLIGMLLLLANLLLMARGVWVSGSPYRTMLLLIPCILFGWLLVNNVLDVALYYLLIMPGGLTDMFSRYRPAVLVRRQEGFVARQVAPAFMTTDSLPRPGLHPRQTP